MDRVGFIGVGAMGCPIAVRLVEKGLSVLAYDRNPQALANAVQGGCEAAESLREVIDRCEVVVACLPTIDVCKAVALGPDGVAEGRKVKIYIETSTFGATAASEIAHGLAARGITLIDAPVVGGVMALEAGTLGVLASGPGDAFERVKPILASFAGRLFYLGDKAGMSQSGKVMSNAVSYACLLATCEAVAMGMKAGIDMETSLDIINQGSGANFFSQRVAPNYILKGKLHGTGAMSIGVKDVKLFIEEATSLGSGTIVAQAVSEIQQTVMATGPAERDTMTYIHYFTDLAGLARTPSEQ
ncbi:MULTISPECIES: NAD(P)-dependent oxidoreductase [Pseudomonas]|uniref:NAD(P)-dependent oxidoreductase n=1 Tax=Pseudomonas TaxID=286 RepID=UPI000761FF7E|nr:MULTISPECIES: NAD(P)-dependent oxidoreductase [Pseudomonas]